ncbi:MAG: DUF4142 domain-containing protein [Gammaproteobacteria bacterium]|nr:DUF4142 domain-containing protein [Gammaproteobacteria bacterium]
MKYKLRELAAAMLISAALINSAHAGAKLDDATIFAIFDETNTADVWAGRIAVIKAHSADVRELGKMVATDHEAVQQSWRDLAKKLSIIPTPPQNDSIAAKLAKTVALLQSKSGAEFDKAYLKHEILFHQSVIDAIKASLLPAIKNEEFKALVTQALPAFEHHLAETKAVAKKLGVE